ncbi:MAG: Tm-1-like ATP-binding domain-containing protein [Rhodobacter sp.]|nr:Tm-1-like ATP-binding domain-containing protein [Rhodobacter sp.]
MPAKVVLLATLETKREEVAFLHDALKGNGVECQIVDVSLGSGGEVWDGARKIDAIEEVGARTGREVGALLDGSVQAVLGLGGGTGGEIILRALHGLPFDFPKLLITTLPFDPRAALADNAIILVPTLADIAGLNPTLRQVLTNVAAMIAGLCETPRPSLTETPSIGLTALGATGGAADALVAGLKEIGEETTVFHANGYGGAAYTRFAEAGAFKAVIDLTCHELTRSLFSGAHVPMPTRFTAAAHLPQIVLPGALNFLGLGALATVPPPLLDRPHYQHSGYFTHVKLTHAEMVQAAETLATHLNAATGPVHVIVPMGGFSHRDCPDGEIEDAAMRKVCLAALADAARHYTVEPIPHHINSPETAARVIEALKLHL